MLLSAQKAYKLLSLLCFLQAEGGVDIIMEMRADINFETDLELTRSHGRIVVSHCTTFWLSSI